MPQAPAHVPAGRERRQVPHALPRRHGRPDRGVRGGARSAGALPSSSTATRASSSSAAPTTASITSPPYPGLIDYHEQHRYAYELLGLDDRRERELGAAARGTSKAAIEEYVAGIAAVLARSKAALRRGAPVCIVVNDRRELYPEILDRAGLRLDERLERHVNRRTGRRAGEYFESILICR